MTDTVSHGHKEGKGTVASLKGSILHESTLVNYAFALVVNTLYLFIQLISIDHLLCARHGSRRINKIPCFHGAGIPVRGDRQSTSK